MTITKKLILFLPLGFFLLVAAFDIWGFLTPGTIVPAADQARDENANRVVMVFGATDETGYVQPTRRQLIDARGPGCQLYHLNPIMSWIVQGDGQVIYKAEPWV